MRLLSVSMLLMTVGLVCLVVDSSPLVHWWQQATAKDHSIRISQKTLAEWAAGATEEDVFSTHQLGVPHILVNPDQLPEGVEQDSTFGAELLARSMEAGFGASGTMWYMAMRHTTENLQMAAASGSSYAIQLLATDLALKYCDTGRIDPEFAEAFLAEYEPRMRPERQREFYPDSMRDKVAESLEQEYDRVVAGVRQIPNRFIELCEIKASWTSIGGPVD